jgi:hypothetical protein
MRGLGIWLVIGVVSVQVIEVTVTVDESYVRMEEVDTRRLLYIPLPPLHLVRP